MAKTPILKVRHAHIGLLYVTNVVSRVTSPQFVAKLAQNPRHPTIPDRVTKPITLSLKPPMVLSVPQGRICPSKTPLPNSDTTSSRIVDRPGPFSGNNFWTDKVSHLNLIAILRNSTMPQTTQ